MTWKLNANGEAKKLAERVAATKAKILSGGETSQGRRVWPQWDGAYGGIKWRDASLLDRMSLEQLTALVEEVANLRRQMNAPREVQQERLQNFADDARGHAVYHEGDTDSLSGDVRYVDGKPVVVGGSETKPSADPKMGRSAITAPTAEADKLFRDPTTGRYYTRTALNRLVRTNQNLFRMMMRSGHIDFMNQLLAQAE